ncbi:MAG: hypothetical protein WBL70_17115 [Candidatus Acidiferrales bacterium]
MTTRELIEICHQDISAFKVHAALSRYGATIESPLPPANDQVDKYEEPEAINLLFFARANEGKPILVEFSTEPSKSYEHRLRQAAKARYFTLHFFRSIDRWAAIKVHGKGTPDESDERILKSMNVRL